jgi:hypothetical protein
MFKSNSGVSGESLKVDEVFPFSSKGSSSADLQTSSALRESRTDRVFLMTGRTT